MSVLLETSVGDITIDLFVKDAPLACENFLKLCKIKYYNFSPVYNVQPSSSFQTGDPIGPGSRFSDGGCSIWSLPNGASKKPTKPGRTSFKPEISRQRKHAERGTVSLATTEDKLDRDVRIAGSQFIITLGDDVEQLDGKAAIFGEVVEGFDALEKINSAFIDASGRPLQDIRILHTVILDDPYDDPIGLVEPPASPVPSAEQRATVRIAHDEILEQSADPEQLELLRRERDARAQALTLELIGDLPFAEVTPPEQILFVCKLNPITRDEDLELIFSRFGKILSCNIIRDKQTGDSLQYAFIEFANKEDCERAYAKMADVLIDDHRIKVDFSQSVSKYAEELKRPRARGFGGVDSLEKRQQYRNDRRSENAYDYVFGAQNPPGSHKSVDESDRRVVYDAERRDRERQQQYGSDKAYDYPERRDREQRQHYGSDKTYDHPERRDREQRQHHGSNKPYNYPERQDRERPHHHGSDKAYNHFERRDQERRQQYSSDYTHGTRRRSRSPQGSDYRRRSRSRDHKTYR